MRKVSQFVGVACLTFGTAGCVSATTREVRRFAPKAEFIFFGTVEIKQSSTLPVADIDDLAVVRVDRILRAPPVFDGLKGDQITVRFPALGGIEEGQQLLIFANGWLFGESVAVSAVRAHSTTTQKSDIAMLQEEVARSADEMEEKATHSRLARAVLVVSGEVVSVEPDPKAVPMMSEHDPEWFRANVKIANVLKGNPSGDVFWISFAGSADVMWFDAPKLRKGDRGIFILHDKFPSGVQAPRPAVLAAEDFRSLDDLELVKRLVR